MRHFILILLVFISQSCSNTDDKLTSDKNKIDESLIDNGAELTCEENTFDFGDIIQGVPVSHDFIIKNTGKGPLLIVSARAGCSCTVPKKPDHPIDPGLEDIVRVQYDAKKIGNFKKTITLTTNVRDTGSNRKQLIITGNVILPQNQ